MQRGIFSLYSLSLSLLLSSGLLFGAQERASDYAQEQQDGEEQRKRYHGDNLSVPHASHDMTGFSMMPPADATCDAAAHYRLDGVTKRLDRMDQRLGREFYLIRQALEKQSAQLKSLERNVSDAAQDRGECGYQVGQQFTQLNQRVTALSAQGEQHRNMFKGVAKMIFDNSRDITQVRRDVSAIHTTFAECADGDSLTDLMNTHAAMKAQRQQNRTRAVAVSRPSVSNESISQSQTN